MQAGAEIRHQEKAQHFTFTICFQWHDKAIKCNRLAVQSGYIRGRVQNVLVSVIGCSFNGCDELIFH